MWCASRNRAVPCTNSTPWLVSSWVVLRCIRIWMLVMRSVSASTSTSGSLFSSPMPRMRLASDMAPPVAIIVFDGMQSHRCAAPPTTSRSTRVTCAPKRAA